MPHPCPNLQEILALEAKIRGDLYDQQLHQEVARKLEAELVRDILYIKKK